jgi:3-hydroxypropanoate dehydrogenase
MFPYFTAIAQAKSRRKLRVDPSKEKTMATVSLAQLFQDARTHNAWLDKPVSDEVLRSIYETFRWGPTSANGSPARIVFVRPGPEKEKLLAAMLPGNVEKTKAAPVTAILAHDIEFYEKLPQLFPHADMKPYFVNNPELAKDSSLYNAALRNAYFMIAARAHGLDVGPMAGFNKQAIDERFLKGTTWRSNLVCNLGYGDKDKLFPRSPRLAFDEVCKIIA